MRNRRANLKSESYLSMSNGRRIRKILISTLPRSGTVFFFDFMASLFAFEKLDPRFTGGFRPVPPEWNPYEHDRTYLDLKDGQVIAGHYSLNREIHQMLDGDELLGVYLYRDPRDVAVSAALYIKYVLRHHFQHPLFSRLSEAEAISLMLSGGIIPLDDLPYEVTEKQQPYVVFGGMRYYCDNIYPWLEHPKVATLRYEEFTRCPEEALSHSLESVGVVVSKERIEALSKGKSFVGASGGRAINVEDKTSHFRKGIVGDYQNHFTELHRSVCKLFIGDDLIRLGYEKDYSW